MKREKIVREAKLNLRGTFGARSSKVICRLHSLERVWSSPAAKLAASDSGPTVNACEILRMMCYPELLILSFPPQVRT